MYLQRALISLFPRRKRLIPTFFPLSLVTCSLPASFRTIEIASLFCFLIDGSFFRVHCRGRKWTRKGKMDAQDTTDDNSLKWDDPDSTDEHVRVRGVWHDSQGCKHLV